MNKPIFLLFLVICLFKVDVVCATIDLEEMHDKFVLTSKRLSIPNYPDAFNPSLIRWDGALLLSFRARDPITFSTNIIGFVWLDDDLNVASDPYILKVYPGLGGTAIQDPRMILIKNELYIVYSNTILHDNNMETRRVFIAKVDYDGKTFSIDHRDAMLHFDGDKAKKWEKNWVPFEWEGKLLLGYSITPHKIFRPRLGSSICKTIACTKNDVQWNWGEIFGGSPASIVDGEYLAFFHSSCTLSTEQSNGKEITHYFMGAYTFDSEPPFGLTKISTKPIIGPKFYTGPMYKTWKPLRVIYPCGFVFDEKNIWVSFGRQDHEVWVTKLDKKGLYQSLKKVTSKNEK